MLSARAPYLRRWWFWTAAAAAGLLITGHPLLASAAAFLCIALLGRNVGRRTLWTVRNRLIVTYLLLGLAPVVLFALLAGIAAYLFSGQFATNAALAALDEQQELLKGAAQAFQGYVAHAVEAAPNAKSYNIEAFTRSPRLQNARNDLIFTASVDGKPLPLAGAGAVGRPMPAWPEPGFGGIVEEDGRLYLRAVEGFTAPGAVPHIYRAVISAPLTHARLDAAAQNLGTVFVLPFTAVHTDESALEGKRPSDPDPEIPLLSGGALTPPAFFVDPRILFTAPLPARSWQTGARLPANLGVLSRASLLYRRLFSTSVRIGAIVRVILILVALFFMLLEGLALYLALRLSRTITQSVSDLYRATMEIDHGNFSHRIRVQRDDQLGALSASFNRMTASLADLLEQQREKQRLENELSIAQQVQNNLFPQAPVHLPGFELFGQCRPARTVSGDYYDFIHAGPHVLLFALGDISGKGISAALLMASLHAAVRAFTSTGSAPLPGTMLAQLNRHLLASTQPEKYATLFLAAYNPGTRELTYANAGQPPPLLLRATGRVERLEVGGSVIGLLPNQSYDEGKLTLEPGDLLAAYSDGVTEPENAFGEFGENRLLMLLEAQRGAALSRISSEAMQSLRSWIGPVEQPDDITLLLARQL